MKNVYSASFARIYDDLMGDYSDIIHLVQSLVYEQTKEKNHINLLELGCGTGNVLNIFPPSFNLYGMDISLDMLSTAKKKVKRATFFQGDMSRFSFSKKFDVIISPFEPINHLLHFSQWESTFSCVAKHLVKNGVFIFDVNTPSRHKALVQYHAYVKKIDDSLMCMKVHHVKKNLYNARFEVFIGISKEKIEVLEENVYQISFPLSKIKKALKNHFYIEKIIDANNKKISKSSYRAFFVCRRRT